LLSLLPAAPLKGAQRLLRLIFEKCRLPLWRQKGRKSATSPTTLTANVINLAAAIASTSASGQSATGYRLAIGTGAWGWSVASAGDLDGSNVPRAVKSNRTSSRVSRIFRAASAFSASTTRKPLSSSRPAALGAEARRLSEAMIVCGGGRAAASLQEDFDNVSTRLTSRR